MGKEKGDMAAQVPNYGGLDTGGAGGPAPEGGLGRNRTMAEGQSLLNGVIGSQNPIAPGSRTVTTGSEVLEQPRGSGLPRRTSPMTSSRPRVEFPDGSSAVNTGQRVDATTGSAQDAATGSGANAGQRVDVDHWVSSERSNRTWRERWTTCGYDHWVGSERGNRIGRERTKVSG